MPLRGDPLAGESELLRLQQTDLQRPGERTAIGRDQTDLHVRIGEIRLLPHVDHVAERHDAAAEPHCGPVHGGDHGDSAPGHPEHEFTPVAIDFARRSGSFASSWR